MIVFHLENLSLADIPNGGMAQTVQRGANSLALRIKDRCLQRDIDMRAGAGDVKRQGLRD